MELNPKIIKNIGWGLLIGPAIGGIYTILINFNVIVFGATVAFLTLAIVFITFGYISPSNEITQGDMQILIPEPNVQRKTRELLLEDSVSSVDFLTAGLESRKPIIINILKNIRKPVRVAVQDPEKAITESEKSSTVKTLNDIVTKIKHNDFAKKNLKFRFYSDHASLRLTLTRDRDRNPISAILGWYTYSKDSKKNTLLQGSLNPSILISQPDDLVKFANEEFNNKWRKATPISFRRIKRLYEEIFIEDRYYEDMYYGKIKKDSYRQILNIMARKSNDWVSKKEIKKKFKGKKTTLENGIKALRDRNIILSKPGSSGFFRLQLIGFAVWISKNNSRSEQEKQNNSA